MSQQIAIVTGAAQGIGRAIALRLAEDGIDVAVNDIASKDNALRELVVEIQAKGQRSIAIVADVSNEKEVKTMVERAVFELGGLDIMIANAGIGTMATLIDMSTDVWDRTISINLRGVMLCYKYAAQQMIKQGRGGRIIGASSVAGRQGSKLSTAYSATKFAVRGLTQSLALELAEHNITVNSYAPGLINTQMVAHPDDDLHGGHASVFKKVTGFPENTPSAGPEVVASLVSYIVKPEAYFITGQSMLVGGWLQMN